VILKQHILLKGDERFIVVHSASKIYTNAIEPYLYL